ncbi:MAG: hypothetical protein L3J98_12240 [Gammaproteobacteria bacterium]|nr:hypothetical protein [Gammaproteobacteria bacterium]MCF6260909.1 hypothetical protein [Gammaproteobacteria bacterium]
MRIFKYYTSLRAEILEVVTGVENSGWSLFWDETTPNCVTKNRLEKLYQRCLGEAKDYGLYVVTRHCGCTNPKHSEYPVSNEYGLEIIYKDSNYVWNGGQMYQGIRSCVCPCSSKNKLSEHNVIDDVLYEKNADQELCKKLEDILTDVVEAIESARDKNPRSAIRENLLRAVLRINDQLLPEPMDSYIQKQLEGNA